VWIRGVVPSNAAALPGSAAVVGHGRYVLYARDLEARGREGADRGLAPRARTLHEHVHLLESVFLSASSRLLGGELCGERRGLARALEADVAGARPRQRVALEIGDRDDRVVEGRL